MKNARGFTLVEILIATALSGVIFTSVASVYVSAFKMFKSVQKREVEVSAFLVAEHLVRRIGLGNLAAVSADGLQIKIRWDYQDYRNPLGDSDQGTPSDFSDDTYLKYGIMSNKLHYRIDAAEAGDVDVSDPEVQSGARFLPGSKFSLINPRKIEIRLIAEGSGLETTRTVDTSVELQGRALA